MEVALGTACVPGRNQTMTFASGKAAPAARPPMSAVGVALRSGSAPIACPFQVSECGEGQQRHSHREEQSLVGGTG